MAKLCVVCSGPLPKYHSKTCSEECYREWRNACSRKRYQERRVPRFCVICNKLLSGKQKKVCSDECFREWRKKYYLNNREKIRERKRLYRQNNPEKFRERDLNDRQKYKEYYREYRQNNIERAKEYAREHYLNNREKILEVQRKYHLKNPEKKKEHYLNNREKILEKSKEYYLNNREKVLTREHKRYRHIRGLPEDCDLFKPSSIELIMEGWLQESDIMFEQQHRINFEGKTWTYVDFYIPKANVCLYCDGDYWHSLPEVQERDIEQNRVLASMGYSVVRMSESEILEGNRPWWIGELISAKW